MNNWYEITITMKNIKKPITLIFETKNSVDIFINNIDSDKNLIHISNICFNKNEMIMYVINYKTKKKSLLEKIKNKLHKTNLEVE